MAFPVQNYKLLLGLVNILYLYMKKKDVTDLCYTASPEHAKMYEKIGIYPFAEPKLYPKVGNIAVPLLWHIENTREPYKSLFEKGKNVFL